jgi:hypothetical protein
MEFCLRIDLDYVPWDADEHGDPAMVVRLLDQARTMGWRHHFFGSTRTLRAFPPLAESILNDGHDLAWICPRPEQVVIDLREASTVFGLHGEAVQGAGLIGAWPAGLPGPEELKWYSSVDGTAPPDALVFPTLWISPKDAAKRGLGGEMWGEMVLEQIAGIEDSIAVRVQPAFLARVDPRLKMVEKMMAGLAAQGRTLKTMRERA